LTHQNRWWTKRLLLLFLILLAFFLRVWRLPQTPPGLWYDEAYYSMDATWLLDGGTWPLFFVGNNGREPMFIYAQVLFIWIFGAAPLTSHLIGPLVGTLTIPLIYVLAKQLTATPKGKNSQFQFVPYLATAALATSFWHIGLSRTGFRVVLLPPITALVFYTFWRGWRENSFKWLAWAGLALGLSQYSYLAARIFPLTLGIFWILSKPKIKPLLSFLISAIVFAPLGWLFYQNPDLFSSRTGDVLFVPHTVGELLTHFIGAVRLFIDSGDPNWRHHLQGRPMLGWFGWLGFWPGLFLCLRHFRQAAPRFLLIALLTLFLPALLSVPEIHALRLSSLLPIYYIIFAIGLGEVARWRGCEIARLRDGEVARLRDGEVARLRDGETARLRDCESPIRPFAHRPFAYSPIRPFAYSSIRHLAISPILLIAIMLMETGLTSFNYFERWANHAETYIEYNGPLVDLVNDLIKQSHDMPILIPLHLYIHPTTRYLLHDHFAELPEMKESDLTSPVRLVTLPDKFQVLDVANIPDLPAFVWLSKGTAHVSRPLRLTEQSYLERLKQEETSTIYHDRLGRDIAHLYTITSPAPLFPLFTDTKPQRLVNLQWADLVQLVGYEVMPLVARRGEPIILNLYWHSLTNQTFDYRLFLQLIDGTGKPITQWEGNAFMEDMYRWRPDGILPTQHKLWLGPTTPPGPYLIRLGFFKPSTGERLPLSLPSNMKSTTKNDQVQLGLFYVSADSTLAPPTKPLSATFTHPTKSIDQIQLIGLTLPGNPLTSSNESLAVTLYWRVIQPTDKATTVFLQLLNQKGEVVSGWDSQPFDGLYPTDLWSPDETISDTFKLPLPANGLPHGTYRLITGFYDLTTGQRLPLKGGGDFVELGKIEV